MKTTVNKCRKLKLNRVEKQEPKEAKLNVTIKVNRSGHKPKRPVAMALLRGSKWF